MKISINKYQDLQKLYNYEKLSNREISKLNKFKYLGCRVSNEKYNFLIYVLRPFWTDFMITISKKEDYLFLIRIRKDDDNEFYKIDEDFLFQFIEEQIEILKIDRYNQIKLDKEEVEYFKFIRYPDGWSVDIKDEYILIKNESLEYIIYKRMSLSKEIEESWEKNKIYYLIDDPNFKSKIISSFNNLKKYIDSIFDIMKKNNLNGKNIKA